MSDAVLVAIASVVSSGLTVGIGTLALRRPQSNKLEAEAAKLLADADLAEASAAETIAATYGGLLAVVEKSAATARDELNDIRAAMREQQERCDAEIAHCEAEIAELRAEVAHLEERLNAAEHPEDT